MFSNITSTQAAELSEHIVSLKLYFAGNRQHDPKGFLDAHFKQNHIKGAFIHEYIPNDSIYNTIDTFLEVLARAKSKEEQSLILYYQKELRDRIRSYRALELYMLEKVRKNNE